MQFEITVMKKSHCLGALLLVGLVFGNHLLFAVHVSSADLFYFLLVVFDASVHLTREYAPNTVVFCFSDCCAIVSCSKAFRGLTSSLFILSCSTFHLYQNTLKFVQQMHDVKAVGFMKVLVKCFVKLIISVYRYVCGICWCL